jgi:CUB/sushi domain-containing protein
MCLLTIVCVMNCIVHPAVVVDCGNLTSPLQGYVLIDESTFGSIANYSCFEGYELDGNMTRTCLESGSWMGNDPICNGKSNRH